MTQTVALLFSMTIGALRTVDLGTGRDGVEMAETRQSIRSHMMWEEEHVLGRREPEGDDLCLAYQRKLVGTS